jgi:hypothetical protein
VRRLPLGDRADRVADRLAPPTDLGSLDASASQSFVAHTRHVTERIARAAACVDCHPEPVDVLSAGHAFDDTPAVAEVDLTGGRSPTGAYDPTTGTCSGLACHGNGRTAEGVAIDGMPGPTCAGCHPRSGMTPEHVEHHRDFACEACHADVTADGATILAPLLHIDGARQVSFSSGTVTWSAATDRCDGACHGTDHAGARW